MSFTKAAIVRNRVTAVMIAVLGIMGLSAYLDMPRQTDPGFVMRAAQVVTYFPGASPERVEQLVTDRLEEVVQEIPELDFVSSQSKTGLSVVIVQVRESYKNMRPIWDSLRRKVDRIRPDMPEGAIGPIVNDEFGDVFGIMLTISSNAGASGVNDFSNAELKDMADEIRDELLRDPDIAKVEVLGTADERIFVEYNGAQLARVGLSPMALSNILESRNIIMPGGHLNLGDERIILEPSGNFASLDDLRRTVINHPGTNEVMYLGDLADISRGYIDPPRQFVKTKGEDGLVVAISMRAGGNLLELGEKVDAVYENLPRLYPHGVNFDVAYYEPDIVVAKVSAFESSVLQSIGIVLLVMLLTLGLRTGAIVAALIPTTMLISFLIMNGFDIYIEQVSLAALIIALGLLVDNAIVMSESIIVQMREGKQALAAAVDSAKELQVPLLTSSLTTAAAFLPIFLSESSTGEYTAPLFKVVSITLLVSWGLALTLTPLLCVMFLKVDNRGENYDTALYRGYRRCLEFVLHYRWFSLATVVVLFVGSMQLFPLIPAKFFPGKDDPFFMADFSLAEGTPIERTNELTKAIDQYLTDEMKASSEQPGITRWTTFVGASPTRFVLSYNPTVSEPHKAVYMIHTNSHEALPQLMKQLEEHVQQNFPGVVSYVRPLQNGPPVTKPIQVRLSGSNSDQLFDIVDEVQRKLATIAGTKNIGEDWGPRVKKLKVSINEERARRAGISNLDVAVSMQSFLSGMQISDYREEEKVIPVTLRSIERDRDDVAKLEALNVFSQSSGRSVPLRQVADVELDFQPNVIKRRNRYRTVTVESELAAGVSVPQVISQIEPWLKEKKKGWGLATRYEFGGELESSEKANAAIGEKIPIGILIIVLLLVWQFNSLRKPLIVLSTVPLGMMGVVLGLLAMDSYFGFMTFLGVISLAGIVINNAIVLLERIQLEIDNGMPPHEAIVVAAQRRARPILLTTLTTIASLVPLYMGGGVMFEPMAVAIMGGLSLSTLLTLGVVPLLYSLMFKVKPDSAKAPTPSQIA